MRYANKSKTNARKESAIRFNILAALQEMATFNGIDIQKIKTTEPYSFELNGLTSQKIASELKKLIDYGLVVKEVARGQTVKYMLRDTYEKLLKDNRKDIKKFGYGDYRDDVEKMEAEESEKTCQRISYAANRPKYQEMW